MVIFERQYSTRGFAPIDACDVLFIAKTETGHKGLGWNAWHSCAVLRAEGIDASFEQCAAINVAAAVAKHAPTVAVLMAFWLPAKAVEDLAREFPATTFVIKNHSGPQFLAQETPGWRLLFDLADLGARLPNVRLAAIKSECVMALRAMGVPALEMPNVYSPEELQSASPSRLPGFHVGLFGAFRPLKNAVGMAFAAALAQRHLGQQITLHVNGTRSELGAPHDLGVISEICRRSGMELVRHGWLDHAPFKALAGQMRVCVASSFSETYNYVAADCVTAGTPVVGSDAVFWLPRNWRVNPDSSQAIAAAIIRGAGWNVTDGLAALRNYNAVATARLVATFGELGVTAAL